MFPNHVRKQNKALYDLKQAPRAWYNELRQYLLTFGFTNIVSDSSLFTLHKNNNLIYLLVYVDDIIVTSNLSSFLETIVTNLANRFSLKDLGDLSYFLGVEVMHHPKGLFLSQKKYIHDILYKANMEDANSSPTLLSLILLLPCMASYWLTQLHIDNSLAASSTSVSQGPMLHLL